MRQITNTFTIIFVLAALASIFQLGSLGNGITTSFADSIGTSAQSITPASRPIEEVRKEVVFEPDRIVITTINTDLLVFSEEVQESAWTALPHAASFAANTSLVNAKKGNVGIVVDTKLIGLSGVTQLANGSEIVVYGDTKKAVYTVTVLEQAETSTTDVFTETKKPTLTIVTVDGDFTNKQYVIKAELVRIEESK